MESVSVVKVIFNSGLFPLYCELSRPYQCTTWESDGGGGGEGEGGGGRRERERGREIEEE